MTYYVGNNAQDVLAGIIKRYFYGLRRNNDGELYMMKADQLQGGDENVVTINTEGAAENNFLDFEEGIDFLDGLDDNHNIVYDNLRYPQMRWDGRSVLYYVDPVDGQLIVRINEIYQYPDGISSEDLIYQNG
jgi:hypothetical protein